MSVAAAHVSVAVFVFVAAAVVVARDRARIAIFTGNYRQFLLTPWKILTFVVAEAGMIFVAPLSGDPTWDHVDAATMGALTFVTAPFAVGTVHRCIVRREPARRVVVALFFWLLSASWSYDFWILARDGFYPHGWWSNLVASSVLYVAAGLFWSLEHRDGRGVVFAFMLEDWPSRGAGRFSRIAGYAAAAMLFVLAVLSPFLWSVLREIAHR